MRCASEINTKKTIACRHDGLCTRKINNNCSLQSLRRYRQQHQQHFLLYSIRFDLDLATSAN